MALATAIDATLFSWDASQSESEQPRFGFAPALSPDGKRAELRAFGAF